MSHFNLHTSYIYTFKYNCTLPKWTGSFVFKNIIACSQDSPGTWYVALSSWSFCLHFSQIGSTDTMLGSTWVLHLPFPEFQTWIFIMLPNLHESLRQWAMYFLILFSLLYMCLSVLTCVCLCLCRYLQSPKVSKFSRTRVTGGLWAPWCRRWVPKLGPLQSSCCNHWTWLQLTSNQEKGGLPHYLWDNLQ